MYHAAFELKEQFARVAVILVLFDRIVHALLSKTVLQFKGHHGQPVDEQAHVQGKAGLIG